MGQLTLSTQWFGAFLYEEEGVRDAELFPADPKAVAQRLRAVREGESLDEEERLIEGANDPVTVRVSRLAGLEGVELDEEAPRRSQDPAEHDRALDVLHEAALEIGAEQIRDELSDRSRHLTQAVAYLDESHEVENLLGERLVAWYKLHAPGVVERTEDHLELARLIRAHGDRSSILEAKGWPDHAVGAEIPDEEAQAIEGLAASLVEQAESRKPLESFIDELAREVAPNVSKLTTPAIAARLIHHAGGLRELAKQPASTIQMLGAEEAVFQHLVEGAPPPKHGVIFQHPLIHRAHPNDRGKIARALAGKLAIAARADAFTRNDIAGELKAEVEARAEEVSRVGRRKAIESRKGGG